MTAPTAPNEPAPQVAHQPRPGASWPLALLAGFTLAAPLLGAVLLIWAHESWLPQLRTLELRWLVFVVGGALLAGLSLLPTHAVSLVAGMVFGGAIGTASAALAVLGAALVGFVVMRPLAGPRTTAWLESRPRVHTVHHALLHTSRSRTIFVIVLVRLSPLMPFALTNLWLAGVGTRLPEYAIGSFVGLLPRIALVAVAGAGLAELDLSEGSDRTTFVLGTVATILALAVIGRIGRRALAASG